MSNLKGGGSNSQTTTTTSEPPRYLQPFLQQGMEGAQGLYNAGPTEYYPGQTVVGFSPETQAALGMVTNRANAGSPVMGAANSFATNTLNGATPTFGGGMNPYAANTYRDTGGFGMGANPMLDRMFNQAADQTQIRLASEFAGKGRNIGASRPARQEELGNLATKFYGGAYESDQNRRLQASEGAAGRGLSAYLQGQSIGATGYESERDRLANELSRNQSAQLNVLGMAPGLAQADYADADRLAQVGAAREDLTGRQYEDAAARFDFAQNAPGLALDQYLARLQGYPGMVSSATTPIYSNPLASGLGGALAGYGIGSQFGYGGLGAGIGAGLGLIGGR